jgi:hypothetical protein
MKPQRLTNSDLDLVVGILKTTSLSWVLCYHFKFHKTRNKQYGEKAQSTRNAHPGLWEGPSMRIQKLKESLPQMGWLIN